MSEWITDRPPTEHEVGEHDRCWSCNENGEVKMYDGFVTRTYWQNTKYKDSKLIAWMLPDKPEPYQPPKPKRERKRWKSQGDKTLLVVTSDGSEWVDGEINTVLPGDPDPDEAIELNRRCEEVAVALERACENAYEGNALSVNFPSICVREMAAKLRGDCKEKSA